MRVIPFVYLAVFVGFLILDQFVVEDVAIDLMLKGAILAMVPSLLIILLLAREITSMEEKNSRPEQQES
jgi:hypothetical protein